MSRTSLNVVTIDGVTFTINFKNCDLIIDEIHHTSVGSSPILQISTHPKSHLISVVCANKVVRVFQIVSSSQIVLKWKFQNPIERPSWIGSEFGGYTGEYLLLFTSSSKSHTSIYITQADTGGLIKILTCTHGPCIGISVHCPFIYIDSGILHNQSFSQLCKMEPFISGFLAIITLIGQLCCQVFNR